jgi:hypothetical protein
MTAIPFYIPETSSYLATLSIQRPAAYLVTPSTSIFSTVDSRPQGEYYWNGNVIEEPKELELVANILVGMKSKKVALGDERVRPSSGQKRAIGSDSDDSHGIEEPFSDDSDDLLIKPNLEFVQEGMKKSFESPVKRMKTLHEKSSDSEEKLGSPVSMFDAEEILGLDGDEQEQIQDSSDESPFRQSYHEFVKTFQESRSRIEDDITTSPKPKRRFHGTPFATIACEYHTQLHARCPPNCPERRPARPHPRSKKAKLVEDFEEPKKQDTPRSSDSEIPMILDEDEDYEESDSKSSRLSASQKARSKKNNAVRSVGRTGRKYLPQACDRHKLLHAKCPANCPDRIARDQKLNQDMIEDSDC